MSDSLVIDAFSKRDFLTVDEAAIRARVHSHLIWELLKSGVLTRHRRLRDKRTYVKASELDSVMLPKPANKKLTPFNRGKRNQTRSEEF